MPSPSICFCAIFRNESRNVRRCLDAARPVIDFVSILDTGSTDDTVALIEQWGREHGVPTRVHHEPFVNFGASRTRSFELARASFPQADYLLLLDADMVLKVEATWSREVLTHGHYALKQVSPPIEYWNTRLIRADQPWRCVGVTHEMWACDLAQPRVRLDSLWIDDIGDGGCKDDKLERDKRLLLAAFDDPGLDDTLRARYAFYLGQTCQSLGELVQAREWYGRRVAMGLPGEEQWHAQYSIADIGVDLNLPEATVIAEHLAAFRMRPWRIEPLWLLALYFRQRERWAEGYVFGRAAKDLPMPPDGMFVRRDVYEWRLLDEFSVCAYWVGQYRESAEAIERMLGSGRVPAAELPRIARNLELARTKR